MTIMARTKKPESVTLTEYFGGQTRPLAVDREGGLIRDVRVLGLVSKNGRTYKREALTSAIGLYEGAKVNIDHPRRGESERGYRDRIGILKNVRQEADGGLRADLKFNPKHPLAEQLIWDAEHSPESVGCSHNVEAVTSRNGKATVVESIVKVHSVDLVADPATTNGLFEQENENQESGDWDVADYTALTLEEVKKHRPDLAEALVNESAKVAEAKAKAEADAAEAKALREQLAAYQAKEALAAVDAEIASLVTEHKLPAPVVTDGFKEVLRNAKDKAARESLVKALAESIAKAPTSGKPTSKEQNVTEGATAAPLSAKDFALRIAS